MYVHTVNYSRERLRDWFKVQGVRKILSESCFLRFPVKLMIKFCKIDYSPFKLLDIEIESSIEESNL